MAEYQALAPATRQLATTPPFTVAHCSSRDSSLQPLHDELPSMSPETDIVTFNW